jgi:3-oxoacyl-[acyl-carrier-protein] synthase-3
MGHRLRVSRLPLAVLGTGSVLPGARVSNAELLAAIERHCGRRTRRRADVALARLGVNGRHLVRGLQKPRESARPGDTNSELAARAVEAALAQSGLDVAALGYLIGHTTSPQTQLPPSVSWAADELQYAGPYMELRQACTGFANALQVAGGLLREEAAPPVAIVGSETGSLYFELSSGFVDREQVVNCVQMCDGAGAVLLGPGRPSARSLIEAMWFGTRGLSRSPGFWMEAAQGGEGPAIFRHDYRGVREHGPELFEAGVETAAELGYALQDFDHVLPHQANGRMAEMLAHGLGLPASRVISDGADIGNLGSASIWVSFDRLRRSGRLQAGETVLVLGAEATKYMFGGFVYRH